MSIKRLILDVCHQLFQQNSQAPLLECSLFHIITLDQNVMLMDAHIRQLLDLPHVLICKVYIYFSCHNHNCDNLFLMTVMMKDGLSVYFRLNLERMSHIFHHFLWTLKSLTVLLTWLGVLPIPSDALLKGALTTFSGEDLLVVSQINCSKKRK